MIPVKIQCGCGQRYAFDADPVEGWLASSVNCPAGGADGTAAANEVLAQSPAAAPAMEPQAGPMRLHLSTSEPSAATLTRPASLPASAPHASQLGLVDRNQAEIEARAKVSWGDPPDAVLKYLMIQGWSHAEAAELTATLFQERAVVVRGIGVKKIVTGVAMMGVPVAGLLFFLYLKFIPIKIMGILLAIGVWGCVRAINGAIMVLLPKMQSGDVAEQ